MLDLSITTPISSNISKKQSSRLLCIALCTTSLCFQSRFAFSLITSFILKEYRAISSSLYTTVAWVCIMLIPAQFIHLFNSDPELIRLGVPALNLYFFGFFMMSFQFAGQSTFVALENPSRQFSFPCSAKPSSSFLSQYFCPSCSIWG